MSAFATAAPCPSGPWLPRRVTKSRHHPAAAQKQQQQAAYTAVDTSSRYRVFTPPLLDVRNLLAGDPPTPQQIAAVQRECEATGFLAITGHGISSQQLAALFTAARQLFDLPLETKLQQMVVSDMQAGRGYEISPEHKAYMQEFQHQRNNSNSSGTATATATATAAELEPSALDGILSERFCCGPELTPAQQQDPFYSNDLGRVFFPRNPWPAAVPELQPQMLQCYAQCEDIAAALMGLFAIALGLQQQHFDAALLRHHSNLQVANYPSQLSDPGPQHLRKKAHVDSGTLTLLASEDWLPGSCWQAGDGGLQLLSTQQEWLEVQVPTGALLVNLGSLMTRWTNTLWASTLHRVTNPAPHKQHSSRRLSMAFFHKPAHDAVIEVLPTCYSSSSGDASSSSSSSSSRSGSSSRERVLPREPLYPPAVVGDLTRQGILHKLRHLPPEEASQAYHAILAGQRCADHGQETS